MNLARRRSILLKLLAQTTQGRLDGRRLGVWTEETTQVL